MNLSDKPELYELNSLAQALPIKANLYGTRYGSVHIVVQETFTGKLRSGDITRPAGRTLCKGYLYTKPPVPEFGEHHIPCATCRSYALRLKRKPIAEV